MDCGRCARQIGHLALIGAWLAVLSLLGSGCGGNAPSPSNESTGSGPLPAQTEAKVQEIVDGFQETNQTPGVLIAIWSPRGRFVQRDLASPISSQGGGPLNADMQFKIASQTRDVHRQPHPTVGRGGEDLA